MRYEDELQMPKDLSFGLFHAGINNETSIQILVY